MVRQLNSIRLGGHEYVIVPRAEFERLSESASEPTLPPFPKPDRHGNFPAIEYARAGLARKIILARRAAGLTQRALAKLAGISVEHLCRVESGRHTPTIPTIDKIDAALARHGKAAKPKRAATKRRTRR